MCVLLPKRPNSGLSPELHPREINRLRRRRFSLAYFWPAKVSDTAPLSGRFVFRPPNSPPPQLQQLGSKLPCCQYWFHLTEIWLDI